MTGEPSNKYFLRVIATLTHDSDIVSDIPSGSIYTRHIYSDILFCHSIWHSVWHILWHPIWHSFWHMYLAYLMKLFLAFYLVCLRRFFVVQVRQGTLWSGAHGWGLAGNTAISLEWRGGGGQADTKSTNPRLTGGEKGSHVKTWTQRNFIRTHGPVSFGSVNLIEALVRARHSNMGASKVRPWQPKMLEKWSRSCRMQRYVWKISH